MPSDPEVGANYDFVVELENPEIVVLLVQGAHPGTAVEFRFKRPALPLPSFPLALHLTAAQHDRLFSLRAHPHQLVDLFKAIVEEQNPLFKSLIDYFFTLARPGIVKEILRQLRLPPPPPPPRPRACACSG
jgi:hypothetical protein